MSDPSIWVLVGARTGDNNQVLALAEAIGLPFRQIKLSYNWLRAMTEWLGPTMMTLDRASRRRLAPPWPDLVIGIGRRSVPVSRWIRRQSGGRTRIVLLGNPRIDPGVFDLVITTRQYPVPDGDNVLLLPSALSRFQRPPDPTADEARWLSALPHPRRLVAIGGATKYWRLSERMVGEAIAGLKARQGGSLIVVTSRRTDPAIIASLRAGIAGGDDLRLVDGSFPRFAMLLGQADEIYVTADSISMLSEAILTGKPVGLIPIEQDRKGRRKLGDQPTEVGRNARRRDLRRFWQYLVDQKAVGSIDQPSNAAIPDPNAIAAEAVRAMLRGEFDGSQPR